MKIYRSATTHALCTLLIGALVILFPTHATRYLVITIGVLFLVPGVLSLITYGRHRRQTHRLREELDSRRDMQGVKVRGAGFFPLIGTGSILFGLILVLFPSAFKSVLLYILGAYLVIAAMSQLYGLLKYSRLRRVGFLAYMVAVVIGLAGVAVIVLNYRITGGAPEERMEVDDYVPALLFGVAGVIYGVSELFYALFFRKPQSSALVAPTAGTDVAAASSSESDVETVDAEVVE